MNIIEEEIEDAPFTWEEYVNYQKMIAELSLDAAELYTHICKLADTYGIERDAVLDIFFNMFNGIDYSIDAESFDTTDTQHLS